VSLTSSVIIRSAYIRIGAWQGDSAEINAQYNADSNFEQIVSEAFPAQSMWDMLTGVENEIATAVAMNQDNTLRDNIFDIATVTSGGRIPSVGDSSSSAKIIGVWGQVRQASTGIELTPGLHEDEIRAIVNGPTGLFKSTLYSYALRPPRIYSTVSDLQIDVCVFNYAARAAAIAANGALLFQMCQDAYFYGLMSNLSNEDANYTALASQYKPMYQEWLASQQPPRDVVAEAAA
jgi:hypothetical protein